MHTTFVVFLNKYLVDKGLGFLKYFKQLPAVQVKVFGVNLGDFVSLR